MSSQQHHRVWTAQEGQEQTRDRDRGQIPIRGPILLELKETKETGVSKVLVIIFGDQPSLHLFFKGISREVSILYGEYGHLEHGTTVVHTVNIFDVVIKRLR